jgi:hypothetical protein
VKKLISVALSVALLLVLAIAAIPASANLPSAKATAQIADLNVVSAVFTTDVNQTLSDDTGWTTILTQQIKTANQKDLFISPSLQSALLTATRVSSKDLTLDTSSALAGVAVKVEVDGVPAFPGATGVIYNQRLQVLSAKLAGLLDTTTGIVTPEEISLLLDTLSANSFNFIVPDLTAGEHTVVVLAKAYTTVSNQQGSAGARAAIGLGSVTVEEVRMIKGENVIIDLP